MHIIKSFIKSFIKSLLHWFKQVLPIVPIVLSVLSFMSTVAILLYILDVTLKRGNLLQVIWPLSSSWPSILTIVLCCVWIRGACAYLESFTWQFVYLLFSLCSFAVVEFHYAPEEGKAGLEMFDAFFWMLVFVFGGILLMMDVVKLRRGEHSPSENEKFNLNVWKVLSYPIFFFLFGSLVSVIPGMSDLIKNAGIGKTMIALLVVTCPLEVIKTYWDAMGKDDNIEVEKKLDDLLSKVQNATDLASSLKDSQNRIEERVQDIDEKISRPADDEPGISFRKSNSTYELKITMRRR